jgi:hypothetical protein
MTNGARHTYTEREREKEREGDIEKVETKKMK